MACESSCQPSKPCNKNGCLNAAQTQEASESQQPAGSSSNAPTSSSPVSTDPQGPDPQPNQEPTAGGGTVRIGVGNTSSSDINIEVTDNLVTGGRHGVHLGSGNHAAGANTGFISGNVADADNLLIGVDNYAAGGNNDVQVYNNDFRGFANVRIGVGNYAGKSNRIIVGGPHRPRGPNTGTGPSREQPSTPPSPPLLPPPPPPLPSPPQPSSGFGPVQPYIGGYGPRVFGPPSNPYYNCGAYFPAGPTMWAYTTGPGPNPAGTQRHNSPPFGPPGTPQQ